ncbi:MAG: ABC transporter permease [Pseudomonadota bacterium]
MVRRFPASALIGGGFILLLILVFMLLPLAIVAAASVTAGSFLTFPPQGFSLRWYGEVLASTAYLDAARTSLILATAVTASSVVIGTAAAIALHRRLLPGTSVLSALFLSPLVLPTIIFGIGLLIVASIYFGGPSLVALWVGHTVITVPYIVRTVAAVLSDADPQIEEAARTMGARPLQRLWFVVLPQARAGIIAGGFFAFNVSFDEAVVALFLRSPGVETLPMRIYGQLEFSPTPAVAAVSTLMILLTILLIVAIERFLGLRRVAG